MLLDRHLAQAATTNPMGLASNSRQGTTPSPGGHQEGRERGAADTVVDEKNGAAVTRPPPPIPWDWLATPVTYPPSRSPT